MLRPFIRCYSSGLVKNKDLVSIKNLKVSCITGKDFWSRPVLQPLDVSIDLSTSFRRASRHDDLKYSLNYATISRNVLQYFARHQNKNFHSLEAISDEVFKVVLNRSNDSNGEIGTVTLTNTKSAIRCDSVQLSASQQLLGDKIVSVAENTLKINGLKLLTLIGIFNFERLQKQVVELDIDVTYDTTRRLDYTGLIDKVTLYVESANFKTVEALVENVAHIVLTGDPHITQTKVAVLKPNAILFSDGVGVSVVRTRLDLDSMSFIEFDDPVQHQSVVSIPNFNTENEVSNAVTDGGDHTVYIAFGSNHGDPFQNIYKALDALPRHGVDVVATSTIYESKPMYHLDQPNFYNGVIKAHTRLRPHDLLHELKRVEYLELSRVKKFDNGPRSIDLDILLYDDVVLDSPELKVPHIAMIDRTFVMAPLCELVDPDAVHPVTAETFHSHLTQLLQQETDPEVQESNKLVNVVPYNREVAGQGSYLSFDTFNNTSKTLIMGILNVTPDSFSDGGVNAHFDAAVTTAKEMINGSGVDIIDIGGCSTRPESTQVDEKEEINRVIPVIRAIRNFNKEVVISIDTYRSRVAEESILAGANIINDISSGQFDDKMFDVVAKYRVPYVMNHTRGDINTMSTMTNYNEVEEEDGSTKAGVEDFFLSQEEKTVGSVIAKELYTQISKCLLKGVYKWQIILDPGIGFAKTVQQNLAAIKTTPYLKQQAFFDVQGNYFTMNRLPVLLAPSRKKFIGEITGVSTPSQRLIGNCSTLMACIGSGADIIRTHDYKETQQVRAMGDALYKGLLFGRDPTK